MDDAGAVGKAIKIHVQFVCLLIIMRDLTVVIYVKME